MSFTEVDSTGRRTPSGSRAGFWTRFAALFIDSILVAIVGVVLILVLGDLGYALSIGFSLGYFTYFEGGPSGQTPGKKAMDIRVMDIATGREIDYSRALIRNLGRIVSGIPIYLGYFWMLWDPEKQCWHDKFAKDVVVPVADYPPPRS